jgi:Luciferase-like monooxygenase
MKISFRFSKSPGSGTFWTTLDDWNDMDFIHFLSSHMLDPTIGGKRLYKSVVEQALHAEKIGYHGVAIPEHHLVNILLIPSPLQMAVKLAAHTSRMIDDGCVSTTVA